MRISERVKCSKEECAEAVSKKSSDNGAYFLFGKMHAFGKCWWQKLHNDAKICTNFHFDDNVDSFQLVSAPAPKASDTGGITFPADAAVRTDWAHERVSKWMKFEQGKSYPFKLERKVQGRTESTGIDGWN